MAEGKPRLARAFDSPGAKLAYNRRLFATIAPRYDLITRLLSYGQDARWKRRVSEIVRAEAPPGRLLDLACGTGDIALSLADGTRQVVGLDLTTEMLTLAVRRFGGSGVRRFAPAWIAGDMTRLPFATASFDAVTTSYGLRNVPSLDAALDEVARVLRPGGLFVSLDFNKPESPVVRAVYLGYLTAVGAVAGLALHGDSETYRYIPHSIRRYPGARGVAGAIAARGFERVRVEPKLGGLMTIHAARRSGAPQPAIPRSAL
ncbi:MAG TPA: ubiquinone/menaquinone biosynthesis methyltransferase [Vicinamibacterales bacterium]|nr:ubiquinone/menaquinone biosynthesis methyltransferase [Vicinamibacterales bacterium]